jgi:hypothetical protein
MDHNFDTELFSTETEPRLATWDCSGAAVARWIRQGAGEVVLKVFPGLSIKH